MTAQTLTFFNPFLPQKRDTHILISIVPSHSYDTWITQQSAPVQAQCKQRGFTGQTGQIHVLHNEEGEIDTIFAGSDTEIGHSDGAKLYNAVEAAFSKQALDDYSFEISQDDLNTAQLNRLHIGWGWAAYKFEFYKKPDEESKSPALILSNHVDAKRVKAHVESVCLIRDLVNLPANDMGPDELEHATKHLTEEHGVALKVIKDKELLENNFPMIYDVGKASTRRPRLLDFTWGEPTDPHITLVGKGVCFDTGGLDIKPSQFMLTMKKDMGGSAHVLGLAHMIMRMKLPIYLRVLIPAVENSISGEAYRPSDILQSRKGITVEVGNTDAEGRLVLADAMAYACEEKPELLIDYATLTGAARVALGYDLPGLFSNRDETAQSIQAQSAQPDVDDAVWHLPLWQAYRKDLDSPVADISSTGSGRAGATNAALFLETFIDKEIEWLHLDCYAWEQNGKDGRPKGGADTGMRAIYAFLEERYGQKS